MKTEDRSLLQERVRTLVLRHALDAALSRLSALSGSEAEDELLRLEHAIMVQASGAYDKLGAKKAAVADATRDAIAVIRAAFDGAHDRLPLELAPVKLSVAA